MSGIVIVGASRTPIGSFNGGLASVHAAKLGETVIKEALNRAKVDAKDVSEVIMGQVLTGSQGQNPARQAAILAKIPVTSPAMTINQVCGSGLKAVGIASMSIQQDNSAIIVAGGQENMSLAPHAKHLRNGIKMGDTTFDDTMIRDGLWCALIDKHMGETAENLAEKYNISKAEQDEFAYQSQQKASKAINEGKFKDEIVPVSVMQRKKEIIIEKDEHPRADTTIEALSNLKPAFRKEGSVSAGNASGINDGAAAVVLMSEEEAKKRGLKPLAKIVSWSQSGVDPAIMGIAPVTACQTALKKAGWSVKDLDLIESNEAFAVQAICVNREMGWDLNKVNVNGGAIALGHPIGASGCRILVSLIHEMIKRDAKKGLATLCVGGGMGVAMCIERI